MHFLYLARSPLNRRRAPASSFALRRNAHPLAKRLVFVHPLSPCVYLPPAPCPRSPICNTPPHPSPYFFPPFSLPCGTHGPPAASVLLCRAAAHPPASGTVGAVVTGAYPLYRRRRCGRCGRDRPLPTGVQARGAHAPGRGRQGQGGPDAAEAVGRQEAGKGAGRGGGGDACNQVVGGGGAGGGTKARWAPTEPKSLALACGAMAAVLMDWHVSGSM